MRSDPNSNPMPQRRRLARALAAGLSGYAPLLSAQTLVAHTRRVGLRMTSTRAKDDVLNKPSFDQMRHQGGGSFANS